MTPDELARTRLASAPTMLNFSSGLSTRRSNLCEFDELAKLENQLRTAIATQNLDEAVLLVNIYGKVIAAEFEKHRDDELALSELNVRAQSLFKWAGRMAQIIRQAASVQLGRLGAGTPYLAENVRRESVRIHA